MNQLTQIKDRQNKVTTYERDANGNVIKVKRPNSTYSTIERNEMGQIVKIVNMGKDPYYGIEKELSKFEYTYDLSGFIKSEIATNGKTTVTNLYTYDARAQLVGNATITKVDGEITENVNVVYTYDNAGNRLTSVKTSGESTICDIKYTYNENNQMTDIEGNCDDDNKFKHVVLSYDVNGNLIKTACNETEKVQDYTYDNENRLKAVHENGALLMAALYDGDGERIFRVDYRKNPEYVSNKGGTAENIYYNYSSSGIDYDHTMIRDEMLIPNGVDAKNSINYELTGYINDINSEYTQVLMEYGANQSITNIYEYGDQRNSATINGQKGYYLYDGRGSVASMTGQSGGNMIQYVYDAYGVTTKTNNTLNNPYQYNAEYTDSSTGNQYLRARYYDAANGRFLTKDTYLGETNDPLSRNLYTYTQNNPVNYVDPSGHFLLTAIAVGAGIGALFGAGSNAYKQYKQNGNSFNNFSWGSLAKDTFIGGTVGAVGGAFGGMAFAGMATTFGTAAVSGGVTLTLGQTIGVSAFSSIAGGMASRYANAGLNNAFYGTNRNPLKEALNPSSMLLDGVVGGIFGGLTYTNSPIYPFGKPSQTKGQQATQRARLEQLKKFCDEHGLSRIRGQKRYSPVDLPEDQLLQQADDSIRVSINAGKGNGGVLDSANYAQKTYSNTFSAEGRKIYSELAGESINTIDDLANAIKSGKVNVSDIPVEYVVRDGNTLLLNTRTSQALTRAGIPRNQWNAINKTGDSLSEELLTGQLTRNKLTSEGISTVRPSGGNK